MSKIQLKLVEDEETKIDEVEDTNEEVTENKDDIVTDEITDTSDEIQDDEPTDFINSDELNEIRDILLDLPDDIELLLLNDSVIVLASIDDNNTFLYTLDDESNDFNMIEMPLHFDNIINNDSIIKYTPEKVDGRHSKVVDILMKKLVPDESEEIDNVKED